jgi:hypothetical protein
MEFDFKKIKKLKKYQLKNYKAKTLIKIIMKKI